MTPLQRCHQLLAEDPGRERKRLELQMEKNAMEHALKCLGKLQGSFSS